MRYLTGGTVFSPKGENALICRPGNVVIVFIRDPRNWLVSFFRWKAGPNGSDADLARFITTSRKDYTPLAYASLWTDRWMGWPGALQVRFEDLRSNGIEETARIAAFLNVTRDAAEVHGQVFGKSGTFTNTPADWREWFGPKATRAFVNSGGQELLERMGYAAVT